MGQSGTGVGSDKVSAVYVHQCHAERDARVGERVDEVDLYVKGTEVKLVFGAIETNLRLENLRADTQSDALHSHLRRLI